MSPRSLPLQKRTLKKASITNPKCSPVSATTTATGTRGVMPKDLGTAQEVFSSNDPVIRPADDYDILPAFRRRCLFVRAALCARQAKCPPAGQDQPSATRINAVASMPAKNAPIIGKAAISFARCERGPPSAHAARRHGSKYFLQSHADAHPPVNERMNNKAVMLNL